MSLASFLFQPKNVVFETQGRSERVILLLRRHPVTQISWIIFSLLLAAIPLVGVPLVLEADVLPDFLTGNSLIFLIFFWYLVLFGFVFMQFLLWFYNVNIVTNERIVDIDFPFLLYKESTATRINQIEDITHRRGGFARTTFNFGDVFVQTAGAQPNIEFLDIPRPSDVVRTIVDIWQQRRPEKAREYLARHGNQ